MENTHKHNNAHGGMRQSEKRQQKGQPLRAVAVAGRGVATEENGEGGRGLCLYWRKAIVAPSFPFFRPPQLSRRRASSLPTVGASVVARRFQAATNGDGSGWR